MPTALAAVATKALSTQPAARYAGVDTMAKDIEAFQSGFGTSAEELGLFDHLRLWMLRNKGMTWAMAIATLVVVAVTLTAIVGLSLSQSRARAAAQKAEKEADAAVKAEAETESQREETRAALAQAIREAEAAKASKLETERQRQQTQTALGQSQIALADTAYHDQDLLRLRAVLQACPEKLRDTNWRYLNQKLNRTAIPVKDHGYIHVGDYPTITGEFLALDTVGQIWLVKVTGELERIGKVAPTPNTRIGISPGGRFAAITSDSSAVMFDLVQKAKVAQLNLPPSGITSAQPGPRGRYLFALKPGGGAAVIETKTGRVMWNRKDPIAAGVFHPSGQQIAVYLNNRGQDIQLIGTSNGRSVRALPKTGAGITAMTMSPRGTQLAVGDAHGDILIINPYTGNVRLRYSGGTGKADGLRFVGEELLANVSSKAVGFGGDGVGAQRSIQVRNTTTGTRVDSILEIDNRYSQYAANARGHVFGLKPKPIIWELPANREVSRIRGLLEARQTGFIGSRLYTAGAGSIGLSAFAETPSGAFQRMTGTFGTDLTISANRRFCLLSKQGRFTLQQTTLSGIAANPTAVDLQGTPATVKALSNDGSLLAVGSPASITLTGIPSGQLLKTFRYPDKIVRGFRFAAGDSQLAVIFGSLQHDSKGGDALALISAENGTVLHRHPSRSYLTAVASSRSGRMVAIGGLEKQVTIIGTESGQAVKTFRAHDQTVTHIDFHPTKPVIATASADLTVKLWNYETEELLGYLLGLGREPLALAFDSSGRYLACNSIEKATRVWNIENMIAEVKALSPD